MFLSSELNYGSLEQILRNVKKGTYKDPQDSATVVIFCRDIEGDIPMTISGPGVKGDLEISVTAVSENYRSAPSVSGDGVSAGYRSDICHPERKNHVFSETLQSSGTIKTGGKNGLCSGKRRNGSDRAVSETAGNIPQERRRTFVFPQ